MKPPFAILLLSLACASAPPPKTEPPAPVARKAPPSSQDDGVEGGVEGGVGGDSNNPRLLPPNVGSGLRLSDVSDPRYRPTVPPEYIREGSSYWGLFKVCVSTGGEVTSVVTLRSTRVPEIDELWKRTMSRWTYRPLDLNGKVYPFCHPMRLEVKMTPKEKPADARAQ